MTAFSKQCFLSALLLSFALAPMDLISAEPAINPATFTGQTIVVAKEVKLVKINYKKSRSYKRKLRRQRLQKIRATQLGENYDGSGPLDLASNKALIINQNTGEVLFSKNESVASPIASITKLMTAMVVLDMQQELDEEIFISNQDVDKIKNTRSRLKVGTKLLRADLLQLALMSSENRAAFALASNYPGGQAAFIRAMNTKAKLIGLTHTNFADPTGLEYRNVSTTQDSVKMVKAAYQYPEIRQATTTTKHSVYIEGKKDALQFRNTNSLVSKDEWQIGLSKTGFINEAGRCLVMQAEIDGEPLIFVLLDSSGKLSRIGDANRVRKWVKYNSEADTITGDFKTKEDELLDNG